MNQKEKKRKQQDDKKEKREERKEKKNKKEIVDKIEKKEIVDKIEKKEIVDKIEFFHFLKYSLAEEYLNKLYEELEWKQEEIKIMGKKLRPSRLICINGDENLSYRYSGIIKIANGWNKVLLELKLKVEEFTGEKFNFALVNLYRNGEDYIGPHSDDTRDLFPGSSIVSVSLGAERDFVLKNKIDKFSNTVSLPHGSMIIMRDGAQALYKHSVPKRKKINNKRINITFRRINN